MKDKGNAPVARSALRPSLLMAGIFLSAIAVLLCSCGGAQKNVYDSLAEAEKQAAGKDTWIVVEFWRHG